MQRFQWKLIFAVAAAVGIGNLSADTMPMWLGSVMESLSLGPERAARVGSAELLAGALASLIIAPVSARIPKVRLALIACLCAAAAYALSSQTDSYVVFAAIRVAAGFFGGLVLATGNAAAASARDPERLFAAVSFSLGLTTSVILILLGYVTVPGSSAEVFLALACIVLLAMPLLRWLSEAPAAQDAQPLATRRLSPMPVATLVALFLLAISGQGLWAFSERIGSGIGLETERIGWWISLGSLVGLSSAALAAWLGTRLGRTLPIVLAITMSVFGQWSLVNAAFEVEYAVSQIIWSLGFSLWVPFVMGCAAELDRGGRWTVVGGAITMIGVALGPWVAGHVQERWPDHGLEALLVGNGVTALLLLLPVTRSLDRSAIRQLKNSSPA